VLGQRGCLWQGLEQRDPGGEAVDGFQSSRAFHGALRGPLPVRHGLGTELGLGVVVRQPFGLDLCYSSKTGLQDLGNLPMDLLPGAAQQRLCGDLPGEGVLEGVDDLREEVRFVEELGGLQVCQAVLHRRLWEVGHGVQHG
jgi:hypothetical protein